MRTAEDRWRLLDPESFREHSATIQKIREASPELATKYGFKDEYPLAESLIEAFWKHVRDSKRPPMPVQRKALRRSLDAAYHTGSMDSAGLGAHVFLSIYSKVPAAEVGKTRKAISTAERAYALAHPKDKRGGRNEDITNTLVRTLLVTYARGTGKTLSIAHPTKERPTYRGSVLRFVCESLELMGEHATLERIADLASTARNYLNRKKK